MEGYSRHPGIVSLMLADITTLKVDAVVNAANNSLLGGGGVDGAIHQAAGPELLVECRQIGGCPTGEARITKGYRLPARYIIHTVGPVWQGGCNGEDDMLARCYQSCFALAKEHDLKSIAFPAISAGAYGFPLERACRIAVAQMNSFLQENGSMKVFAVCFSRRACDSYARCLQRI
jgi:O-acetyl-ADP-ribose deacetylase